MVSKTLRSMQLMKVKVKFVGGKWEEVKKCFPFPFPSIGH
jgi:hypothetical protein